MSTSPIVSRHRRSEPAYSTRSAASRRAPTMSVAVLRATLSSTRSVVMTARPRRMRSSLLGPNPAMFRSLPSLTAASRSLTVAMPSSLLSCMARFGPSPGTRVSSRTPGGTLARCSSTALMVPVRLNSVILAAIDLPTPGMRRQRGLGHRGDVGRVPGDRLGGLLVVPRPERVAPGDGQQLRVLPQQPGDGLVHRMKEASRRPLSTEPSRVSASDRIAKTPYQTTMSAAAPATAAMRARAHSGAAARS